MAIAVWEPDSAHRGAGTNRRNPPGDPPGTLTVDQSATPFGILLLGLCVLLTFALLWKAEDAQAHTIQPADCRAVARHVDAGLVVKRLAARGCTRHRLDHAAAHELAKCAGRVPCIIRYVFGSSGDDAVTVARCESGFDPRAANGQYLGIFQMGSSERATYGHGPDALSQSRAAYRYFRASGSDWSPWECRP